MQDNSHHTYTQAFVDSKWADMATQLDTVLPTEDVKTDNKLIWLLTTLLLFTISVAIYYAYQYKHLIPNAEVIKEHIIYKNVYIDNSLEQTANPSISVKSGQQTSKTKAAANLPKDVFQILEEQYGSLPISESVTKTKNVVAREFEKLKALEQISSRLNSIESTSQEQLLENSQDINIEKIRRIQLSAGLTALASSDKDFTGYGLSSSMDIPLGEKIGFNTGIAINIISKDNYFISQFPRTEAANNLPPKPQSPNEPIVYEDELRSLKQVYVPLGLNYSISDALSFNSGVRLRYTYATELDREPIPTRRYPAEPQSFYDKTNIGISAGLKYSLNGHFSILLDSEWGMGSLARTPDYNNPSRPNHDLNLFNLTTNYTF